MLEHLPVILILGMAGTIWLYVVARVITRAVTRTLDERKRRKEDGEEKA